MDAKARRTLDMTARAIVFSRANPDDSDPGYTAVMGRFEALQARAEAMAKVQREGLTRVRLATAARRKLRRAIIESHVAHLAGVAELAARETPDARKWFVVGRGRHTYQGFVTAIRTMLERAEAQRELLVRYGLSPKVLDDFRARLAEFDAATLESIEGRRAHTGASAELERVTAEAFDVVKALDGINRIRFANDAERLGQWESASSVQATPQRLSEEEKAKEEKAA